MSDDDIDLEDLVERHEERLGELSKMYADTVKRLAEAEETIDDQADRIAELENLVARLRDIGSQKSSKEEKIAAFVTYADRVRSNGQDQVTVLPKRMRGIAGISERYAYKLVDELHDDDRFPWLWDASADDTPIDQDTRQRGLVVDFSYKDGTVQQDAEPLNKFNNAHAGERGSA